MATRSGLGAMAPDQFNSSFADESLFGDTAAERMRKAKMTIPAGSTARGSSAAGGARTRTMVGKATPASPPVMLPSSEFEGIKTNAFSAMTMLRQDKPEGSSGSSATAAAASSFEDGSPEEGHKGALQARIEAAKKAAAQARKEKIKALEAQRLAHVPKTALELEEEAERQRRRELAERMREEATDEAKLMNQLRNYAITVSIRDRQLEEKKEREEAAKLAEKMRDAETELARLEELKRVHEKEAALRAATREAAKGVYKQVEERIAAKQQAISAMRKEGEEMVAGMKVAEQQYRRQKEEQHRKKLAGLADILVSNEEALRIKEERKAKERAEEERIEAVQREMEAKKEALAAEAARLQKEREEALFKVRGETQKAMDTRAAIDELRARRAFEAGQREARQKEAEKARRQAAAIDELKRERIAQLATKQSRLAVEVEADKAEFERARRIQEEWIAEEEKVAREKELHNKEHLRALLRQKEQKEAEAKQAVLTERASGAVARAEEEAKVARAKAIRERKVQELLALGVSSRYTVSLAKFEPVKKTLI